MGVSVTALFAAHVGKEAIPLAEIAVSLKPNHPAGHIWAGLALKDKGNFEGAEIALRRALELDPANVTAKTNLGAVIFDKLPIEATELMRQSVEADPSSSFIAQNFMLATLSSGDLERGWNLYNRRQRFPAVGNQIVQYPTKPWDGIQKGDKGKPAKVLLVGEEGIGERILFSSMVPDVTKSGAEPIIELTSGFERFAPWFKRSFPKLKIACGGESLKIDHHLTIGDLGHMYRRKFSDFPKHSGYMTWDKKRAANFRHRLTPGPVIGICYKSCANAGPYKSVGLDKMKPLLNIRGASFVDLQYQGTQAERDTHAPLLNHIPDLDLINDMDGVAALIGACDLVITVSSVTAHMAGAMGKPVWTLIPGRMGRMWFWFVQGDESPWYPSMKLYRQKYSGDWQPAIDTMTADLKRFVEDYKEPGDG